MTLEYIEISPTLPATASVIWLHGLGASGDNFVPIVPQLQLPDNLPVRFIFPQAPEQPVTLNAGMTMPSWYDIYSLDRNAQQDQAGIETSQKKVEHLIEKEIERGTPSHRIIIAGYSQGGAMALHTALHYPKKLAGILALSTYLPLHEMFGDTLAKENRDTPIFLAHGSNDLVVPLAFAELSKERLAAQGYSVDYRLYPMAHELCLKEVQDIAMKIQEFLS